MGKGSTNPREPMYFVLSDDLVTGCAEIDRQHQCLFDTANAIVMACGPEAEARIAEALAFLDAYARHHHEAEEAVMVAMSYPWLEHHRRAHSRVVALLDKLRTGLEEGGPLRTAQVGLHFAMQDWSSQHVRVVDARLARWLDRRSVRLGSDLEAALWRAGHEAEDTLGSLGTLASVPARGMNAAK
jgi:hemerythrin-like metal-binding protein